MSDKQLDKDLNLKDNFLNKQLILKIEEYEKIIVRKLGNKIELKTIKELKEYLQKWSASGDNTTIDFVSFSRKHIERIKEKQESRAKRLRTTLSSFIDFFGREMISISEITSKILREYENYLLKPRTIKRINQFGKEVTTEKPPLSMVGIRDYMADIRTLFNAAKEEFNDDENDEMLINHYPFTKYKLPKPKGSQKKP